jgi:hypothetical protein
MYVNDICIVLITTNRRPKGSINYLYKTMKNLKRGGVFNTDCEFHIVDSGTNSEDTDFPFSHIPTNCFIKSSQVDIPMKFRCANLNVARALEIGLSKKWILFLEDDIDVIKDFVESVALWIEHHENKDIAIYPLAASYQSVIDAAKKGETSINYPHNNFYGTQGMLFRSKDIQGLIDYLREDPYRKNVDGTAWDLIISEWSNKTSPVKHFITPVPSFVQHDGRSSIVNPRCKTHIFSSFPGNNWSYYEEKKGVIYV